MGFISMAWHPATVTLVALPIIYLVGSWLLGARRPKNFPPGPAPVLGLGNILQLPPDKIYLKLHEWREEYGDILGLKIGSENMVILQTAEHVRELFERRGAIYSDRTQPYIAAQLINPGTIIFQNNGPQLKKLRAALMRHITGPAELRRVLAAQSAQAGVLMRSILEEPANFAEALRHWALSTPMGIISGLEVSDDGGPGSTEVYFETQERWLRFLNPAQAPPVELFPALKHVPAFFAKWKHEALELQRDMRRTMYHMLEAAGLQRGKIAKGLRSAENESVLSRLIRDGERSPDLKLAAHDLALFGGASLDAAVDTMIATTSAMILALAAYPEIQKRLQAEVDEIWGDEVPSEDKLGKATYLKATMRWRPAVPASVPRILAQEDTYRGFTFPKGTTVLANTWTIHGDEKWYANPRDFDPQRYVENQWGVRPEMVGAAERENRRPHYGFGTGRRVCPGLDYAENQVTMTMAKLVWGFDIAPRGALDLSIETGFNSAFITAPEPFDVDFSPRGETRKGKILEDAENGKRVFAAWVE
ncbi:cytochrome p450 [Colletotrichum plurivorum]|uniref:Cytochrome p450 n=1 Tax=Colletotrichum plurivorum TaxID=2175906 RepID=A0A8H6K0J8_9PEZI|nr:cytochrome p450 [Colletotrichum plurivorum]